MKKQGEKQSRANRDAGRERLLDAARTLLRSKVTREVSRQKIARAAGLAPALVTYYFATKSDLVLAVTRPIMADAITKLLTAIDAPEPLEARLRRSIELFIDFARENGPILDLFVEAVLESGNESERALVDDCLDKLGLFLGQAIQAGLVAPNTKPRLLLLAMWGMCRLVGETPPLPVRIGEPETEIEAQRQAEVAFITALILRGAAAAS